MRLLVSAIIAANMVLFRCALAFTGQAQHMNMLLIRRSSSTTSTSSLMGRATFLLRPQTAGDNRSSRFKMTAEEREDGGAAESASAASSPSSKFENRNNIDDQIVSCLSGDGGIKVTACTVRNLVNDMMIAHNLTPVPIDALGRAVACAVLASNGMQDEQVFQLTVDGDGPLRGIVAISSGAGEVRGYVGNPGIGAMPLQEAVGKGVIKVVKNHPSWPTPYSGVSAIRHSDVDRDVGAYLAESEQRSCALAAGTAVEGILCKAAGGYLVEKLPDCDDDTMAKVEQNLATLVKRDGGDTLPTNLLQHGTSPIEICEIILEGLDLEPLQSIQPVAKCQCTEDRLFRALRLLPRAEVDEILQKEEQVEARCQFCGKVYRMSPEQVEAKFLGATGDPSKDEE